MTLTSNRLKVAPQDLDMLHAEPGLCVMTDPMKSVTKLGRANAMASLPSMPPPALGVSDFLAGVSDSQKRKYKETLDTHSQMMQSLADTQDMIQRELQWYGRACLAPQCTLSPNTSTLASTSSSARMSYETNNPYAPSSARVWMLS